MKKIILFIVLIVLSPVAWAVNFTAVLDRDTVTVGETFHLVLTLGGEDPQHSPDFSSVKRDFTLQNITKSVQVTRVNGDSQEKTQWTLALAAKHPGTLTLPEIALGNLKTQKMAVLVKPVSELPHAAIGRQVFIEVSVSPKKEAYVESQLFYTVKLYYQILANLMNPSLVPPTVPRADIRQIPGDQRYQVTRGGKRYGVVEAHYVVFPKTAGQLSIEPPVFSAIQLNNPTGGGATSSSLIDLMNAQRHSLRISADTLSVTVLPRPASQADLWWLPATKVTLKEAWSKQPASFRVGEPITRTLTLTGEGVLSMQLPPISQDTINNVSAYADKAVLQDAVRNNTLVSQRVEKIALVPNKAGSVELPEIRVPWWNVTKRQAEVAVIPAKSITVLPSLHAHVRLIAPATPSSAPPLAAHNIWPYLAALFFVLWLLTVFLWWYLSREKSAKILLNAIQKACEANNPQAVKTALLAWGRLTWPKDHPTNVGRIAELLGDKRFVSVAGQLDAALYQKGEKIWRGAHFWAVFRACALGKKRRRKQLHDTLPPLYSKTTTSKKK